MSEAKFKRGDTERPRSSGEWYGLIGVGARRWLCSAQRTAQVSNFPALGSTHPELNQRSTNMEPIDYFAPTPSASPKARNVEETKAYLAKAEAALAAETARNEFKAEINSKIRLAHAIVQALSDTRDLTCDVRGECTARKEYAEFRNELCATLKEYGYKVVFIGDKSKATVVKA